MKTGAIIVLAIIGAAGPALAQAPPGPERPSQIDPKGCAPGERLQQGTNGANSDSPQTPNAKAGEPLSDKLARTDGVLCPPNVDPDIRQAAPGGGKTPVIPPPGSPGGDQSVEPK
jgi:hypothetical protein